MHVHATSVPYPLPRSRTSRVSSPPEIMLNWPDEEAFLQAQSSPNCLRIRTLGLFLVHLPGDSSAEPQWVTPQSIQVLKCLIAAPGQQLTPDELIERLWPDDSPDHARRRLHDALSKLRRALEPDGPAYGRSTYVLTDRQSLRLAAGRHNGDQIHVWLDADVFDQLAQAAITGLELGMSTPRHIAEAALALYRGPFLPLDRYADWSESARQRYHRLWSTLVRRLVLIEIAERQLDRALQLVGTLTEATPDDEDAVFLAMVVYAAAGRRAEALRMYQQLRIHLSAFLGCAPNPDLQALSETIRSGASMDETLARLM